MRLASPSEGGVVLALVVRAGTVTIARATNTRLALTVYLNYLYITLAVTTTPGNEYYYYYYSHFSEEDTDIKHSSDLYKDTEPNQVVWPQSCLFKHHTIPALHEKKKC